MKKEIALQPNSILTTAIIHNYQDIMKFITTLFLLISIIGGALAQINSLFPCGVASGDPLSDRVIIWTKLKPENREAELIGIWKIAQDAEMRQMVNQGEFSADQEDDFTVKVDVEGLEPGRHYYYQFELGGQRSLIGRTKTAPVGAVDKLRFAVVSCSNYQAGYFNNYGNIGRRDDLDAVIHLGDYIYEYGDGVYGDSLLMATGARGLVPSTEIIKLDDYRARYAHYRQDTNLMLVHQMHPFITVWDDHEIANDAYTDMAQNHQENEGDWMERREAARRAYVEWLPVRGAAKPLYRKIQYGDLAELIMLDTRIIGRDKQIMDITNPEIYNLKRSMLGQKQKAWLLDALENSPAQWKILGNQVMFADYNVGWAAEAFDRYTPEQIESIFLDIWDGYPAERAEIISFIEDKKIDDVVIVTGDVHCSFAYDIALRPSVFSAGKNGVTYNPETGDGSVAVEFVTPGITSSNYDENVGLKLAHMLEDQINTPLPNGINPNPHMKYADLIRHGYLILDVRPERVQADWYFSKNILIPALDEEYGEGWMSRQGKNRLQRASAPAK